MFLSNFKFFFICLIPALAFPLLLDAQSRDTVYTDTIKVNEEDLPKHSPTKAALFSTFVPGLGQAYNKKYWKIPIVYAGIGIPLYYGLKENEKYNEKREAYVNRLDGDSSDVFLEPGNFYSNDGLLDAMDINKRNRDLMYILAGTVYILQILDASVDAHLFYFNVSDDLTLNYTPVFYYNEKLRKPVQGISLCLNF